MYLTTPKYLGIAHGVNWQFEGFFLPISYVLGLQTKAQSNRPHAHKKQD